MLNILDVEGSATVWDKKSVPVIHCPDGKERTGILLAVLKIRDAIVSNLGFLPHGNIDLSALIAQEISTLRKLGKFIRTLPEYELLLDLLVVMIKHLNEKYERKKETAITEEIADRQKGKISTDDDSKRKRLLGARALSSNESSSSTQMHVPKKFPMELGSQVTTSPSTKQTAKRSATPTSSPELGSPTSSPELGSPTSSPELGSPPYVCISSFCLYF